MISHLADNGQMAVVLPHGVLFRGASEGHIRRYLIEELNYLDAVIGLPANIFYGTPIPTCILLFKKCRENDDILFIDASQNFEKQKNQNVLTNEHIEKIVTTYQQRIEEEKFSHKASLEEIKENDYNLNIPRLLIHCIRRECPKFRVKLIFRPSLILAYSQKIYQVAQ